jgi:tripartite-type tricarboxylate transporter receptor subunit TctC
MFYSLAVIQPQIRAGKLRVLAVTAGQRDPLLPDVPTMVESG